LTTHLVAILVVLSDRPVIPTWTDGPIAGYAQIW